MYIKTVLLLSKSLGDWSTVNLLFSSCTDDKAHTMVVLPTCLMVTNPRDLYKNEWSEERIGWQRWNTGNRWKVKMLEMKLVMTWIWQQQSKVWTSPTPAWSYGMDNTGQVRLMWKEPGNVTSTAFSLSCSRNRKWFMIEMEHLLLLWIKDWTTATKKTIISLASVWVKALKLLPVGSALTISEIVMNRLTLIYLEKLLTQMQILT